MGWRRFTIQHHMDERMDGLRGEFLLSADVLMVMILIGSLALTSNIAGMGVVKLSTRYS